MMIAELFLGPPIDGVDGNLVSFFNRFAGKNPLLDESILLLSDSFLLNGILFLAIVCLLWFRDRQAEPRIRLMAGCVTAGLAGLLSRLLQHYLPTHVRPLYNPELGLRWPISVPPGTLNQWDSFPSDHASLYFALATVIWLNDRRWGVFAYLWAAIATSTRVYLGYHYPTDILGGAILGILMVVLSHSVPLPRAVYRLLDWERRAPGTFYAVAFLLSYQAGTLFNDDRAIGRLLLQLISHHHS